MIQSEEFQKMFSKEHCLLHKDEPNIGHACEIHDFFVLLILNREKILLSFYFAILFNKNSFLSLNQSISTQKSTGMSKCQNVRIFHIVQFFEFSDSLIVNGCKEEILEAWSKRNFFSIKLPQNILSD